MVVGDFVAVRIPSQVWGYGNPGTQLKIVFGVQAGVDWERLVPQRISVNITPEPTFVILDEIAIERELNEFYVSFDVAFREDWSYAVGQTTSIVVSTSPEVPVVLEIV